MKLSLIVPTHNRPGLLLEALGSVYAQDDPLLEVIVVDDGSEPPVDEARLQGLFDRRIRVIRNPRTLGIDRVRQIGARAACGDLVWQLDDDDRLAGGALAACVAAFERKPELEVLFVNVGGFGSQVARHRDAQARALERLMQRLGIESLREDVLVLDDRLLSALLYTVPQAFQHPVVRRQSLLRVWDLRARLHAAGADAGSAGPTADAFRGNLNEAEWSVLASAVCCCAFLPLPLYRVRCEDQGYFSTDAGSHSQAQAHLRLKQRLFTGGSKLPELAPWRQELRRAYARALLEAAHAQRTTGAVQPLRLLCRSLFAYPTWQAVGAVLKLAVRG